MTGRKRSGKREPEREAEPVVDGEQSSVPEEGSAGEAGGQGLEERLAESRDRLLRLQAEFENFKKRQSREREEHRRKARVGILKEFLPILDNLERAVEHGSESDTEKIVEGVELVLKQFREAFVQFGVTRMESLGGVFDPHFHEAMSRVETEGDPPDGTVVEVYQEGYLLDGKVLRPAMVGVAKLVDEAGEDAGE